MYRCLVPGCIGIKLAWEDWPALAAAHGFEAVDVSPLEPARGPQHYRERLDAHGIRAGGTALPGAWREDERASEKMLAELPAQAKLASELGCNRFYTWIWPFSDERPFDENYSFHAERLGAAARILADHDCRLGLEFVGPKTSRAGRRHDFIHNLSGMLELCGDVGGNAGLLLDSWHWYTSHGTVDDLRALTDEQVVYVHVNDAPAGIAVDEQQDVVRRLPGETGVVDITTFMGALVQMGYSGPVTPEPFVKELAELAPDEAARVTAEAVSRIWPE